MTLPTIVPLSFGDVDQTGWATVPLPRRAIAMRRRAFALLGTVQATLIFTITVVSLPLPVIGRELGLDRSDLVLVSAAYALSFSGLLLFGGRLADRYGGRPLLVAGLFVFANASTAAALAPGFTLLVTARFGQGVGAALAAPAAMAVLREVFPDPPGHRRAMARWGGLSVLGATAGILLAGIACTWVSWRWMFVLPLLVATVALLLTPALLPAGARRAAPNRPGLDLPAAALATAGITLLSYGLVITDEHAWSSNAVVAPTAAGLVLLGAFIVVEARGRTPLLPMAFLADSRRLVALLAIALAAAGASIICLLMGLYLQQIRDWSPLRTSVAFLPYAVSLILAGRLCRRPIERYGPRVVVAIGLALAAAGLLLLADLTPHTEYVRGMLPGLVLLPAGIALAFAGATVLAMADVPHGQAGLAGGVMNTAMEIGPTVGLAILMAVAAARTTDVADTGADAATTSGYAWAFAAAGLAFAALAVLTPLTALAGRRTRVRAAPVPATPVRAAITAS